MKFYLFNIIIILIVSCQVQEPESFTSELNTRRSELKQIIINNFKSPVLFKNDTVRISTHSVFECFVGEDLSKWVVLDNRYDDFEVIREKIAENYIVIEDRDSHKVYAYNVLGKLTDTNKFVVYEDFQLKQYDSNPPTVLEKHLIETEYVYQAEDEEWKKTKRSVQ